MLFRFCLYGFLKNQQYYDPFLILAFRQKGLSFGMIGVLIGFRAICINLMEIPTGAVADVMGRRRSMMASFIAYIGSFAVFGLCRPVWALFAAMFLFSIGEAFRTGTHKAMIFQWLEHEGRLSEKTAVYGRTRAWSQLGSALSVVIATLLVFSTENYSAVFLFCIIPYVLGIVNFMGYPSYLEGLQADGARLRDIVATLFSAVSQSLRNSRLRRLLIESMSYDGLYHSTKDYVQPVIKTACLSLPAIVAFGDRFSLADRQRVALGVGLVYFLLYLLSSFASRGAGWCAAQLGGDERSARVLWVTTLLVFVMMAAGVLATLSAATVVAFVALAVLFNLWRPVLVSRVASQAKAAQTATVLSIDSQASSLFLAVAAPLLGWSVDSITSYNAELKFAPVAALGIFIAGLMVLTGRQREE